MKKRIFREESINLDDLIIEKESVTIDIDGLRFELTCDACPEQYDVYKGDKQVGYIRLRWGHLTCEYPDIFGEMLIEEKFTERLKGEFDNDFERNFYLAKCAEAINKKLNENG